MDRAPGLSVRLKLTLSYAGFLMLAGAVLLAVGYVSQQELRRLPGLACDPRGGEHQGTCKHEEPGVAQGEFETNAQTRGSIHALLPHARRLNECRCGTRRRLRSR